MFASDGDLIGMQGLSGALLITPSRPDVEIVDCVIRVQLEEW